jgi:four helix bundle protein
VLRRDACKRIDKFEQLIAWQNARNLAREIYKMTKEPPFARDFTLAGQLQRSAVSVMGNIAEGFERNRLAEFHQFLSVAKSSCGELRSHLYVTLDVGYVTKSEFERVHKLAEEVGRVVGGLRLSIEKAKKSAES